MSERHDPRTGWRDLALGLAAASLDFATRDTELVWRTGGEVPAVFGVAFCLLGALLLLGRRRRPGLVMALAWAYGFGRVLVDGLAPWAVPVVALQAFVARRDRRTGLLAAVSLAVPFTVTLLDGKELAEGDYLSVASFAVCLTLIVCGAVLLGWRERQQEQLARLAADRVEIVAAEALAAERRRLARELHDNLGHAITAMSLQAAGARAVSAGSSTPVDGRVVDALAAIETTGAGAMRELHRLLGVLRTTGEVPDSTTTPPGLAELDDLLGAARAGGLVVEARTVGEPAGTDPSVAYALYRVVQEALANAMRHDGPGARVEVVLEHRPGGPRVQVRAWPPAAGRVREQPGSGGFGLAGLRERVILVGGRFAAGPDGDAFVTSAVFPRHGGRTGDGA